LPEGGWQFVCDGHPEPYLFEVTEKSDKTQYPDGLAADLGLYDDLPKCVTDPGKFVEYGIVEYRYGIAHPKEYGQLLQTYGHRMRRLGKYTSSMFLASVLGRLAAEGALRLKMGEAPATGTTTRRSPTGLPQRTTSRPRR
jgi:hypothetical protein